MKNIVFLLIVLSHSITVFGQAQKPKVRAKLRALVDSEEIHLGETFNILITYEVSDWNEVPIQFESTLGQWVFESRKQLYNFGICLDSTFSEIKGVRKTYTNGKQDATRYDLIRMEIKPDKVGTIKIPEFQITMKRIEDNPADTTYDLRNSGFELFYSKTLPIKIQVLPNPKVETGIGDSPPLVGKYSIKESISEGPYFAGDTLNYSLTFSGSPEGFWLDLPKIDHENLLALRKSVDYKDSFSFDFKRTFTKTFNLDIVLKDKGKIDFSDFWSWQYFDSDLNDLVAIQSDIKLDVISNNQIEKIEEPKTPQLDILMALDISQSMQVEDYKPSRMSKAIELAETYKDTFSGGKLIGFSGSITNLNDATLTDSVYDFTEKGTAIGDAIWLGSQALNPQSQKKVMIIIGDGDNTAGHVNLEKAINYAISRNVTIYTVGIGHDGKVPFGKDFFGRSNYVENTYSDAALRLLAKKTGGLFYYLDDHPDLKRIIDLIQEEIKSRL